MSCDCDIDGQPDCYLERDRRARVEHCCCECGRTIHPGETYRHASGIWDGRPDAYKSCSMCAAIKDWFGSVVWGCKCVPFGNLGREMQEHLDYDGEVAAWARAASVDPTAAAALGMVYWLRLADDDAKEARLAECRRKRAS